MFSFQCNIDKTDRINRIIIGLLIILAVIFSMSKLFFSLLGAALIIEGMIGWCSIPYLIKRMRFMSFSSHKKK
jgi:Protein of unknown function (DUF2892)